MSAQEIVLNIAVNLGRLGRWACDGKIDRIEQFLQETNEYVQKLEKAKVNPRFYQTHQQFLKSFIKLSHSTPNDDDWAEEAFTWANILTHRAKLA